MTGKKPLLRDFIYLDWEQVRSFTAQLFEGVPQDASSSKGHEIGAKAQVEGGIPGLLRGHGGGDYRYFRTDSETRSLHHYVYSLLEERLETEGLVISIGSDFDFDKWTEGFFTDGQIIRLNGVIRLMDYARVSTMLEALPKVMSAAEHAQVFALEKQRKTGLVTDQQFKTKKKAIQKPGKEIKELGIGKMTELIKQLYGDVIRVKLLPSKNHTDKVFVASVGLESFHDTAAALSQKYGYEIDAGWVALGQINISNVLDEPLPIAIGNEMEDSFEQAALAINNIVRIASAVRFPAVSFTPISIYRTC